MTLGSGGGNVLSVVVEDKALEHVCLRAKTRFFLLCGTDCWLLLGLLRSAVASAEATNTDFVVRMELLFQRTYSLHPSLTFGELCCHNVLVLGQPWSSLAFRVSPEAFTFPDSHR